MVGYNFQYKEASKMIGIASYDPSYSTFPRLQMIFVIFSCTTHVISYLAIIWANPSDFLRRVAQTFRCEGTELN